MSVDVGPFRFCPGCGAEGGTWRRGHEFLCPHCGYRFFQNVATACGVLIEHEGRYLFLVRAKEPSRGLLGLPGGFVDNGESVEVALSREVSEEIGGTVGPVRFLASFPNQYRFAGQLYHTCDLYFAAALVGDPEALRPQPGEVSQLRWLAVEEVEEAQLAFPSLRSLWSMVLPSLSSTSDSR